MKLPRSSPASSTHRSIPGTPAKTESNQRAARRLIARRVASVDPHQRLKPFQGLGLAGGAVVSTRRRCDDRPGGLGGDGPSGAQQDAADERHGSHEVIMLSGAP